MIEETTFFLTTVFAMIAVGLFIIKRFKNLTSTKRFELVVSYLGGISVLLITYNIFITIRFNKDVEQAQVAQNTLESIQINYLKPQKELLSYYPEGYFLYASMYPDTTLNTAEPKAYNPIKRKQVETYCSLKIFQAVEDFLSINHSNNETIYIWINSFLSWLQSPILQEQWKILNFNYGEDTRDLINAIIEKAQELNELRKQKGYLSTQDYDKISKNFKTKTILSRFLASH
jgi:hypothetical protein